MATDRKKRKIKLNKFKFNRKRDKNPKSGDLQSEQKQHRSKHNNIDDGSNGTKGSSKLEVINGSRKRRRIARYITYAVIGVIIVLLIVFNALSPTGLIEAVQNGYVAMGEGKYPINVYSTNPTSYYHWNGMQCVLNGSFFELYNNDGKLVQAVSHGMSNPNLKMSQARYLLFDRDRYTVSVFNYSDKLYSLQFDDNIVSADIGRDGTFAVVTDSDSYHNTVYVYDKDYKQGTDPIFKWNAANYYVTDIAVADDGEKIALSLIDSKEGSFQSFVYILSFDSSSPETTYKYNDIVSSLSSCNENYVLANGFNRAYIVPWNGDNHIDLNISGTIRCYDYDVNGVSCVVWGREDNEQINNITVVSQSGKVKTCFEFNSTVIDVCVSENKIALLSGNEVYIYNHNGQLLGNYASELSGIFVGLSEDADILVIDNAKLVKIKQ